MSFDPEEILGAHGPGTVEEGHRCLVAADWFLSKGDREIAASALDRAYGLLPQDPAVARQRRAVLDELAMVEHGLVFRYVPAGSFVMGSATGDPDERPVHPRRVSALWITDIPITWAAYCKLRGWSSPPEGSPPANDPSLLDTTGDVSPAFLLREHAKIRLQYCDSNKEPASGWLDHWNEPGAYDKKPLVAVSAPEAEELADALSHLGARAGVRYRLPSEPEWEKAARGGLIGCAWSWGDEPPTRERCDFDRFGAFHLTDPRAYSPNSYGLHSMCGGVAEWTSDRYDALAYEHAGLALEAPGLSDPRVIRGGSWADCAAAVRVSFRASRVQAWWRRNEFGLDRGAPNVGFRLARVVTAKPSR